MNISRQEQRQAGRQVRRLLQPFQQQTAGSGQGGARTTGRERELLWSGDNSYPLELFEYSQDFEFDWTPPGSLRQELCEHMGFPGGLAVKNPPADAGDARDAGLIPGLERSPGVGNGNPLQYSCLEISRDRGAWRVTKRARHD